MAETYHNPETSDQRLGEGFGEPVLRPAETPTATRSPRPKRTPASHKSTEKNDGLFHREINEEGRMSINLLFPQQPTGKPVWEKMILSYQGHHSNMTRSCLESPQIDPS